MVKKRVYMLAKKIIRNDALALAQNLSQIIKRHIMKVTEIKPHHQLEYNCCIKSVFSIHSDCRKDNVRYKCKAFTRFQPKKVYLRLAEGEFKEQIYYNLK